MNSQIPKVKEEQHLGAKILALLCTVHLHANGHHFRFDRGWKVPVKFFFLTKNFLLFDGIVENMQVENNEGEKNTFGPN